jgi:hypothetical protein
MKKKKLTPLPKLLKKAETVFNAWVRKRSLQDNDFFICKNCSKTLPKEELNAGHLYAVKKSSFLRFHEDNVWGECRGCNARDDNKVKYQMNLINEIGFERVEWLNKNHRTVKRWSRSELEEIIKKYTT